MKEHIASWLSNMSVASFVLAMFQASEKTEIFGDNTQYAALAFSVSAFLCSLYILSKK
jgi:hypothetical protein